MYDVKVKHSLTHYGVCACLVNLNLHDGTVSVVHKPLIEKRSREPLWYFVFAYVMRSLIFTLWILSRAYDLDMPWPAKGLVPTGPVKGTCWYSFEWSITFEIELDDRRRFAVLRICQIFEGNLLKLTVDSGHFQQKQRVRDVRCEGHLGVVARDTPGHGSFSKPYLHNPFIIVRKINQPAGPNLNTVRLPMKWACGLGMKESTGGWGE